jgi:protein-disulfide isomerase
VKRWLPYLIVVAVALIATVAGVMLYRANKAPTLRANTDSTGPVHVRGVENAPVTIEEFGDFQCPPCGRLSGPLDQIEHDFAGKVRLIFREFPLPVHPNALPAAHAAEAAGLQKRFWEMHDILYREQEIWSRPAVPVGLFVGYAKTIGLDPEKFRRDMESETVKERVAADQKRAEKLGVSVTPTVFVNGKSINLPALGPDGIRDAVKAALATKPGKS